jgi:Protein of unknown function (DUF3014)
MNKTTKLLVSVLAVLGLGVCGYFWWQQNQAESMPPEPPPRPRAVVQPVTPAPAPAPTPAPAPAPLVVAAPPAPPAPAPVHHPMEVTPSPARKVAPLPKLSESDKLLKESLTELLNRKAVLTFLNLDDFVHRSVATVDNLARGHAASQLWPVVPTQARFLVDERPDGVFLSESNADRYTPFVRFATSVDTAKVTALYARLYPLFQQAYEELGYPGKYFNDRLVEVIDQLLDTPELITPVRLTLIQVQGPIPSSQPWLRYEFEDPALEARPAGQKILLRMGSKNELLLKDKLRDFRERIIHRRSSR